jgi:phosphate/sulfate permease
VDTALVSFVLTVVLACVYAFIGGFTDAANAIATSVGTRAFSPGRRRCTPRIARAAPALLTRDQPKARHGPTR